MVNASRCNLLSRSLPTYQKAMLAFSDSAAAEFHRVLVDLRSHHHHQYKLHSDMEEIRDLEAHELTEWQLLSTLEGGDYSPPLKSSAGNDDDALLDVSRPEGATEMGREAKEEVKEGTLLSLSPQTTSGDSGGWSITEVAKQQAAIANDLPLSGVEADLRALQNELLQEFGSCSPPRDGSLLSGAPTEEGEGAKGERGANDDLRSADMDLNDLLGLGLGLEGEWGGGDGPDFGPLVSSEGPEGEGEGEGRGSDVLVDQWNNFSSFMGTTRTPTKSSLSEWEKEFSTEPPSLDTPGTEKDPFEELDPLAAAKREWKSSAGGPGKGLADDLLALSLSTTTLTPSAVAPSHSLIPSLIGPMAPLPPSSQPHPQATPTSEAVGGASSGKPRPPTGKESEKKGSSWMNVFAHLDPLSNEKA